jgi:hypothetical protein
MVRAGVAVRFASLLLFTGAAYACESARAATAAAPDSASVTRDAAGPSGAARDSMGTGRRRTPRDRKPLPSGWYSLTDATPEQMSGQGPEQKRRPPPYPKGLHWPDRPLLGVGTHVPRGGHVEMESEAVSYTRTTRTERSWQYRWTTDTTGYGFPHYVYFYGPERFRRETARAAVQQYSIGISSRVALMFAGDGYINDRLTASQRYGDSHVEGWHVLNAVKLKVRAWGSDSSRWSQAIAVESAVRDDYGIIGCSFAQDFPLGRRTMGRLAAGIEGASLFQREYVLLYGRSGHRPTFDSTPLDAGLAIEHRFTPVLWGFAECTLHRDLSFPEVAADLVSVGAARAFGDHFMLDAGARFGTTRQAPDVQGFLGFSLR